MITQICRRSPNSVLHHVRLNERDNANGVRGNDKDKGVVFVDGEILRVPATLEKGMRNLRRWNGAALQTIWIDVICIDQSAATERNHQIPLMGTIYERAEISIIWLGEEVSRPGEFAPEMLITNQSYDIFRGQNHTLEETRTHMKSKYGLNASLRQYKRRFSGLKNLKAHEWIAVVEEVRNRAMRKIDSEVCLYSKPIDRGRVKREVRRYGNKPQTELSRRVVIGRSARDKISIRTPLRRSPSPSAFPATRVVDTSAGVDSLFLGLDCAGGINVDVEEESGVIGDFDAMALQPIPSLETFFRIGEDTSNNINEDIILYNHTNRVTSPFVEYFDFGEFLFDGNSGSTITINLPWFQLQQLLEQQELFSRTNSPREMSGQSLWGIADFTNSPSHNRNGAATDLAVTERHRILCALLGYNTGDQVADLVPNFTSYLSALVPERFEGELAISVQQFFDPTHKYPLQRLFGLTAFFISNNQLAKDQINNFLQWVMDQNNMTQLDSFLHIDTATTRIFAQRILEAAVSLRNTNLLRSLLLSGVDFRPVIQEAIQINDSGFLELLISRVDPECLLGDPGGRLLSSISRTNYVRAANMIIENGANINFVLYKYHRNYGTPLYQAVSSRKPEMVKLLLENGANVNISCFASTSPAISEAVSESPVMEIVDLLLEHGADIKCSVHGQDLLDYVSLNHRDIYRLILDKRGGTIASVTVGDILEAAHKGSRPLSEYLDHHRGSVTQKQLETALCESIKRSFDDINSTLALLECGVDPNGLTLYEPPLLVVATCDQEIAVGVAQHLVNAGANVNVPELLSRTVEQSNFDLLYVLLDAGADLSQYGPKALEAAALAEEVEAIALLLDYGAPINDIGESLSPFQAAASLRTIDLAQYLLDRGADVNTQAWGHGGRTALQAACETSVSDGVTALEAVLTYSVEGAVKEKLFKLLLDNGAEVCYANGRIGKGILHKIVQQGLKDLIEIALDAGADINKMSSGKEGRTPLQLAAELGRLDIVQMLVVHDALVNASPAHQYGRTALQAAASRSSPNMELLRFLVDNEADVNAPAGVRGGITAIQGASIAGNIPVIQFLLAKGADINGRPALRDGRTAIEGAAEHGRLDTVQLLLNYGATGDVVGGKGLKKAKNLAKENGHTEIVKLLRSAQPDME
ncbi:hypothetical protein G7Y89_g7654 [Cudoniella acicularis]|uniref:Heterokaryon incompatibility domain-containing protein n=1 Tax=Cudoniella acicularis TaxID=354080 RepID=A0A8H4W4C2_9HELO|nr:hypothetical protein G7Y89_g7654 [Cudoniella acicularis]